MLLGLQSLTKLTNESSPVGRRIKRFIQHENFRRIGNKDDIALIELDRDVPFHYKYLRPACLQQTEYEETNVTAVSLRNLNQQLILEFQILEWLGKVVNSRIDFGSTYEGDNSNEHDNCL